MSLNMMQVSIYCCVHDRTGKGLPVARFKQGSSFGIIRPRNMFITKHHSLCVSLCLAGILGTICGAEVSQASSHLKCVTTGSELALRVGRGGAWTPTEPYMLLPCLIRTPATKLCFCREGNNGHW
ncbi:hypothetical protein BD310DRAFT_160296 [Dichomitus squalens]|nr:hypothetical protein BD310DRAFT_160296 [Dichomitus squalens]